MWEIKPEKLGDPEPAPKTTSIGKWIVVAVILLAGAGYGIWRWYSSVNRSVGSTVQSQVPVDAGTDDAGSVPTDKIADGDSILRELGGTLSGAPEIKTWLAEPGLIRRLASAVNLLADGDSPREVLGFLSPKGKFEVTGDRHIAPRSYQRYDLVTNVITSIDVSAAGKGYRALLPYLRSASAEVGKPNRVFETALREAMEKVINAPIPDVEPLVKEKALVYVFVDPKLEGASALQKHLLRMGLTNARALQRWVKSVHQEIFPP